MSVAFHHTKHSTGARRAILLSLLGGAAVFVLAACGGAHILVKGNLSGSAAGALGLAALGCGCFFASWASVRLTQRFVLFCAAGWAALYFAAPLGVGYLCGQGIPDAFPTHRAAALALCSLAGALLGMVHKAKRKQVV